MKCKYCNAEIEQDAQFCPNCGKDLSKLNKCVKCGEILDDKTVFCPYCGAEQPIKAPSENGSKKVIKAGVFALIIVFIAVAAFLFFKSSSNLSSSSSEVTERLNEILRANVQSYNESYFTKGFVEYYRRECEKADEEGREHPQIWWQYSDSNPESYAINSISDVSDNEKNAVVTIIGDICQLDFNVTIKKVDGQWLVDKITEISETYKSLQQDDENSSENYRLDLEYDGYDFTLSNRRLTAEDLEGMSKKELEIMRNSVYAKYGYKFKREDLFEHFSNYSWYKPNSSDNSEVYNRFTENEKYNVDFIKKHENN